MVYEEGLETVSEYCSDVAVVRGDVGRRDRSPRVHSEGAAAAASILHELSRERERERCRKGLCCMCAGATESGEGLCWIAYRKGKSREGAPERERERER